jgi:hypothetical protein
MPDYPIVNGDLCQVTNWATYQSSRVLNVWHFEAVITGTGTVADGPAEVLQLITKFEDNVISPAAGTKWLDWTVNTFHFDYLQGQIIDPIRRYYMILVTNVAGSTINDGVASNVGATVSYQSNMVGRGRTGSKHFTGQDNADMANGTIMPALYTKIGDTSQKSIMNIAGTDPSLTWQPRIWSGSHPTERNKIVSQYTNPNVRIMRRRTLHVGI